MKKTARIFLVLLIYMLIFSFSSAFAITDLEAQIYNHNSFAEKTGATIIDGDPEIDAESMEGYSLYKFVINGVTVSFITKEEMVVGVICRAEESDFSEFFSQCLSCMYNFKGVNSSYLWAQIFLDELAAAKAGKRSADDTDQIKKMQFLAQDGIYAFILEK